MPQTIDSALRARVDAFVADLSEQIREAALEAVREALGGAAPARRRGPGRPRKKAKKATRRKPGRPRKKATKRVGRKRATKRASKKRMRRSPEDLDKTAARILAYVKTHPGKGVTAIAKSLRKSSKDLKRPVQMLLAAKKLRTEGQRRGTTYFAGAGGAKKTAKRKASGKRKAATRKRKAGKR